MSIKSVIHVLPENAEKGDALALHVVIMSLESANTYTMRQYIKETLLPYSS